MKHWLIIISISVVTLAVVGIGVASFQSMKKKPSGNGTVTKTLEGEVVAGRSAVFLPFTRNDYQRALDADKIIFLDFYANWCPYCRAEAPELEAGFEALESDKVIGFRVNYNDGETDEDEKALAKQYAVTYQHTKVILKDGKEVFRTGDTWTRDDFASVVGGILAGP